LLDLEKAEPPLLNDPSLECGVFSKDEVWFPWIRGWETGSSLLGRGECFKPILACTLEIFRKSGVFRHHLRLSILNSETPQSPINPCNGIRRQTFVFAGGGANLDP
jgi:hypothetical protein